MRSGILLAVLLGGTSAVVAETYHVPGDFPTIQAAILAALEGDEIIVAPGTYNEAIFFNGHNINLHSESGPEVTIIDATGLNNSVVRVILGEGPTTVLEGFTITGGMTELGGGIYCSGSNPTIRDCIIAWNTATTLGGGGMYNFGSDPTVEGCVFTNNLSSGGSSVGGAVYATTGSDLSFSNCRFELNQGTSGGAIYCVGSTLSLTNCKLEQNVAVIQGGGIYVLSGAASLTDCSILNNHATQGGGGAFLTAATNSFFTNCLIADNTLDGSNGAGLNISGGIHSITNCTIADNSGQQGGGISFANTISLDITNCVAWGNTPDSLVGNGEIEVSYSNIEFGWPGCDFCILADPLFVDPAKGNYRLGAGSPCVDLGNNAALPKGVDTDLDGQPRFVDDPDTPDCPQPGADCGSAPIVDMGAYEFQALLCPWDLDGNASVGASDLLALLVSWGPCKGCPADFDGNGTVGASDLLALLVNWGPCP